MMYYGVWIKKTYAEQPVPIEQIDNMVYVRRNIEQTGDVWNAEERAVPIDTYHSEVQSHKQMLNEKAESIVIASEYAAAIMPKQTLMKSAAVLNIVIEIEGDQPLTPSCMETLAQSYAKLIREGVRTIDDVLTNPPELKPRVNYLLREPNEEEDSEE